MRASVVGLDADGRPPVRGQQIGIDAGQSDRLDLVGAQRGDQLGAEQPRIYHLGHFEGGIVGNPPARHHHRLLAQPAEHRRGLRAAAVHHHNADAERLQQAQLLGDVVLDLRIGEDVAAELHHEDMVAVGADVAQGALQSRDAPC
jgi:hypothetical protein